MNSTHRDVYLLIYPSPLFAAHWALWLPNDNAAKEALGKVIQVTGNVATGFEHQFKRNYDLSDTARASTLLALGHIGGEHVVMNGPEIDNIAIDTMEEKALSVEAPGPSLRSAGDVKAGRTRVNIRNCQTWLVEYVDVLIRDDILDYSAKAILDSGPKN
ncbi:hypothetical protein Hypma_016124 [Hypsizygus marmoreus]|uniref:Uncharacterized protein n=1 Tax=Hypsizygus marmoreus TaxID=39966 RepID=A0A369K620_HYPMA|nr:hypothetical protein Hypma_016124 [Hypsizygus marmoreus]